VGILVNTWLHKKLQRDAAEAGQNPMAKFDGQQGRPAYVAVDGQLYDVGSSKLWPGGEHMKRHHAGDDLSQDLESAPHGPEVLERLPALGQAPAAKDPEHLGPTARLLYFLAYFVLACMAVILLCLAWWNWGPPLAHAYQPFKPAVAQACLGCHLKTTPAIVQDWVGGQHAKAKVSCLHCHQAQPGDKDLDRAHDKFYVNHQAPWQDFKHGAAVSAVITPKDCARCHPGPVKQFAKSKHAGTLEIIWRIDPWLNQGLTSQVERATGCYQCHGSVLKLDSSGRPDPLTWPNQGVGRVNPDGSQGSCSSCHGRHRFSLAQARKPEACGLCHLGPNHPQMEIYAESKHGAIYHSQGEKWNWQAAPEVWTAGVDYRAPTCAVCHMSGGGGTTATHDVSERLSWELQAPETIRPSSFQPWPSKAKWWQARAKMQGICRQCHSQVWVSSHYFQLDEAVAEYNNLYYKPVRQKLDQLQHEGLLPRDAFFTSPLWVEYYELWNRVGRSARMGAAMMAPDYSWWHGFYECKLRYARFMRRAGQLLAKNEKGYVSQKFPGASGNRNPPAAISKRPRY
jgi:hydroxylamine dehydrogenase